MLQKAPTLPLAADLLRQVHLSKFARSRVDRVQADRTDDDSAGVHQYIEAPTRAQIAGFYIVQVRVRAVRIRLKSILPQHCEEEFLDRVGIAIRCRP